MVGYSRHKKKTTFIGGMELVSLRCNRDFTSASSYGLGWYKYAIATQWYQFHTTDAWWFSLIPRPWIWASYQIRNISGCACTGNAGNVPPLRILQRKPLVSDPGMHVGIAYPRWWGKRSRHSRRMRTCNLSIWQEAHETTLHLTKQIAHSSGDFNIVA